MSRILLQLDLTKSAPPIIEVPTSWRMILTISKGARRLNKVYSVLKLENMQ